MIVKSVYYTVINENVFRQKGKFRKLCVQCDVTRLSQVENALKGQKHIAQGSALGIDTDRNYAL